MKSGKTTGKNGEKKNRSKSLGIDKDFGFYSVSSRSQWKFSIKERIWSDLRWNGEICSTKHRQLNDAWSFELETTDFWIHSRGLIRKQEGGKEFDNKLDFGLCVRQKKDSPQCLCFNLHNLWTHYLTWQKRFADINKVMNLKGTDTFPASQLWSERGEMKGGRDSKCKRDTTLHLWL